MNESTDITIKRKDGYQVGSDFFCTLAEAQIQSLVTLLDKVGRERIEEFLVQHSVQVVAILNPPAELRQRKTRSDKNTKRKKAAQLIPEQSNKLNACRVVPVLHQERNTA